MREIYAGGSGLPESMPEIEEGIDCACAKGQQRICSLNLGEIFMFLIVTKCEPYCTSRMEPILHLRQVIKNQLI